jgi:hypothetical protein
LGVRAKQMIRYYNIALGAIAVAVGDFGAILILGRGSSTENVWGPGGAPHFLMPLFSLSVVVACWAYAKSKGNPGWEGALHPLLSGIGLGFVMVFIRLFRRIRRRVKPAGAAAQHGAPADRRSLGR